MNLKYSYPLVNIFGITVNIDISWLFAFLLVSFSISEGFYPHLYPNYPAYYYWLTGVISAIFLFISVLLHELSHSLVAIREGIPVRDIHLFIFGGVAMIEQEPKSPFQEFKIAIAGPIMSFMLAALFFTFAYFYPKDDLFNGFINYLFLVNFFLGVFNLIPAFPLDGGRILRSILWNKKGLLKATEIASKIGNYFGNFLILMGILFFITGNFINGIWLVFLGIFIKRASKQAYLSTKLYLFLSNYRVDNFLTTMTPLFHSDPIENYITMYYPFYRTKIYPVISKNGDILYLNYEDIKKYPSFELENKTAGDFAKEIKFSVDPSDKLTTAYKIMLKNDLDEIPVMYNNTFVGLLKRDIIESIIKSKMGDIDEGSSDRR
ncbi:MAG: site-2 protease family protein [Hydrogenothermaceae bacterium]|nr:site-2 protease family protein [Hydrogenothermaceae bacterium]